MCGYIVVSAHQTYYKMYQGLETELAEWYMSTVEAKVNNLSNDQTSAGAEDVTD